MKVMTMTTGITDLSSVLVELGVDVRRVGEREISGCCPVHLRTTGKVDRSPSWSMNASTGAWICYSCGAKGSLYSLVSELTGDYKSIWEVHSFLIQSGLNQLTQKETVEEQPDVDWITYNKFSDVPEHLLEKRNLDQMVARKFGIKWNPTNKSWVIPIVSAEGELTGWQEKKKDWVRNYPIGVKKSESLFGVERVRSKIGVLVESPLDVVRLASVTDSVSGLATFGAHVSKSQIYLANSLVDTLIVAMDNDQAGIESSQRLWKTLPRFKGGVKWLSYSHTDAKDVGDMSDIEIMKAIDNAQVLPGWVK
jgi:DNA primase